MKTILTVCLLTFGPVCAGSLLEFQEPANSSFFLVGEEIPLSLRAQADGEVVAAAEVFVDGQPAGTAVYCCPWCPCPPPPDGMQLVLQLPNESNGFPPDPLWKGLRDLGVGVHHLTATAVGSGGALLEAGPIRVTVLEEDALQLRVWLNPEAELQFVLPAGSLFPGGFDMWLSHDLREWRRLGPFLPGDVAAFFTDQPDPLDSRPRFYRAQPAVGSGRIDRD